VTARFAVGASTHPGMVRRQNEDSYIASEGLYVVADGMGGHQAGEVASELAVRTIREAKARGLMSADDLATAVQRANDAIRREAAGTRDRAGMGTTLTGIAVLDLDPTGAVPEGGGTTAERTMLAITNVGDSRTYLWRDRRLTAVTVDHSYVQELVSGGQITEQEARLHPRRNIVTRALGIDPQVRVDTWTMPAVRGDRFVVCSDGLVDEVPDHEIAALLDGVADPQRAAEGLVSMANRHGGRDNVTVVIVDVVDGVDLPDDGLPEPVWAEGLPEAGVWAEPDHTQTYPSPGQPPGQPPTHQTGQSPAAASAEVRGRTRREFGVPQFLFVFAIGVLLMVVIVVVALSVRDDPEGPPPTSLPSTTLVTSTVVQSTTTTTPRTSTTTPRSTTSSPTTTSPRTTTTAP
jgi:serine/threonine protein phosphatase PrpC